MIRLLGEPQSPRTFWLVLLLAVMLLVGISSSPAAADGRAEAALALKVDRLVALGEALQRSRMTMPSPVHPELADGGADWLAGASVRQVRALRRTLASLEARPLAPQKDLAQRRLAAEAERVHLELLTFRTGEDDPARLGRSLAALTRIAPPAGPAAAPQASPTMPTILRGTRF